MYGTVRGKKPEGGGGPKPRPLTLGGFLSFDGKFVFWLEKLFEFFIKFHSPEELVNSIKQGSPGVRRSKFKLN